MTEPDETFVLPPLDDVYGAETATLPGQILDSMMAVATDPNTPDPGFDLPGGDGGDGGEGLVGDGGDDSAGDGGDIDLADFSDAPFEHTPAADSDDLGDDLSGDSGGVDGLGRLDGGGGVGGGAVDDTIDDGLGGFDGFGTAGGAHVDDLPEDFGGYPHSATDGDLPDFPDLPGGL